nr:PREDICTED: m7GpppX diphosphatase [Lepisosteus oculatus]
MKRSRWGGSVHTEYIFFVPLVSSSALLLAASPKLAEQEAVVILEKTPIRKDALEELFRSSRLELEMRNDIYSTYYLRPPAHLSGLDCYALVYLSCIPSLFWTKGPLDHFGCFLRTFWALLWWFKVGFSQCPLAELHALLLCTTDTWNRALPQHLIVLQWVYNILEKKAEADRIVYEDPDPDVGFVLLPDFKWDQKQLDDLYLIAIVHRRDIRSLRDLTAAHLPLLLNIQQRGQAAILKSYGIAGNKLRVYLHYVPTYYHLHVHFTALGYEAPGCGVERAHLLSDVIQNLRADSQYYVSRALAFALRADDPLLQRFRDAGRL